MTALPYRNRGILHQTAQQPAYAPDGYDGIQLPHLEAETELAVSGFEVMWDTYEIWRKRMLWLASTRESSTNPKRLKP